MSDPEPPREPRPPEPATQRLGPSKTARMPWWKRTWGVVAIGLVGLLVGAGIGGAAGGPNKTVTETERAAAQTITNTITVNHAHVVVHTHTVTVPAETTTQTASTDSSSGTGEQAYSGNGGKNLGTITVAEESTLEWTNDGDVFQIFSEDAVPVNSQAHSGSTVLEAGTYKGFQVNAVGNWTIKIVPK
ncbi:MAG: hypothetical protein ABSB69_09310 [Solirubrobacteraceae bacterium]